MYVDIMFVLQLKHFAYFILVKRKLTYKGEFYSEKFQEHSTIQN